MSDPMQELFTAALGISAPWKVAEVRFEPEAHAVHFDLACEATRLPCPTCTPMCPACAAGLRGAR